MRPGLNSAGGPRGKVSSDGEARGSSAEARGHLGMRDRTNGATAVKTTTATDCVAELPVSPGPSAFTTTGESATQSASTQSIFRIASSPSFKNTVPVILPRNASPETSRFRQILETNPAEALEFCDRQRRLLRPDDAAGYLRWANNTAVAQRALGDLRSALRTHEMNAPLAATVGDFRLRGCHFNGLGLSLLEAGEPSAEVFEEARKFFADCLPQALCADNNAGLALLKLGRLEGALSLLESAFVSALEVSDFTLREMIADTLQQVYAALRDSPTTPPEALTRGAKG